MLKIKKLIFVASLISLVQLKIIAEDSTQQLTWNKNYAFPLETQLMLSLVSNDEKALIKLIEDGVNVNYVFSLPSPYTGQLIKGTPLFLAFSLSAITQNRNLFDRLLKAGADITVRFNYFPNQPALTLQETIEQMMQYMEEIVEKVKNNQTNSTSDNTTYLDEEETKQYIVPLLNALNRGAGQEVESLLDKGINPNFIIPLTMIGLDIKDRVAEITPLVYAASAAANTGNFEAVDVLLKKGAHGDITYTALLTNQPTTFYELFEQQIILCKEAIKLLHEKSSQI